MEVESRKTCRICGSDRLTDVIDLGRQLLATLTVTKKNRHKYPRTPVPLTVVRCDRGKDRKGCGLVQLRHDYPHENIYREYWYRSGLNQTMRDALKEIVQSAGKFVNLTSQDVVLDIGCNDGTLLNSYDGFSGLRIGIDPAENIRGEMESFKRIVDFFNAPLFLEASGKKAKVITSIAMFYDLPDPNRFVSDIAQSLESDGIWIVQIADLPEMLAHNMFDQILHEHLEYYHIEPFQYLCKKHGLKIVDVEKNNVNGSSYRFYVRKKEGPESSQEGKKRLKILLEEEKALHLDEEGPYEKFRLGTKKIQKDLVEFIRGEAARGKKTFICGASTKGNVILQYCGLTKKDIPFAADRNPIKWGGWTIGTNIPIISEEEARQRKPDYFLVLPYYFMEEMVKREREFLERGGKFIVPVPEVHCLDQSILTQNS